MRLTTTIILICATSVFASADTLTLRDGQVIRGTFLGGTARQIRVDTGGQVQTYDVELIRSVTFSDPEIQPPAREVSAAPPRQDRNDRDRNDRNDGGNFPGITIPADTAITIRMVDAVNSETTRLGQTFMASLDEPLVVDGRQVLGRGADIMTKLVEDQNAGKLQGRTSLTLALVSINYNGRWVELSSTDVRQESGSQGAKTARTVGGTAALGAIIGGIVGGGKGAAIGAGSGAAVGGAATVMMKGQKVVVPSETRLTFRLQSAAQL